MGLRRFAVALVLALLPLAAGSAQALYWESPQFLLESGARFPRAAAGGGLMAVVWQEYVDSGQDTGRVFLSVQSSRDGRSWKRSRRFAGPFPFRGREVIIYSLTVDARGRIYVAVASGENLTTVLRSDDGGATFVKLAEVRSVYTSLAPYLSLTAGGELLLFVTAETQETLSIYYAHSPEGRTWSEFAPLVEEPNLPINFLPHHASLGGREYVVFQAVVAEAGGELSRGQGLAYQLQVKISQDGGRSWGPARDLGFEEQAGGKVWDAGYFSNQRPFLAPVNGALALVWERKFQSGAPEVYYALLDAGGAFKSQPERVTGGLSGGHFPQVVVLEGRPYVFGFDSSRQVFVAERSRLGWETERLSSVSGDSTFPSPVRLGSRLYVFWENQVGQGYRLVLLQPDQTVGRPFLQVVQPASFEQGRPYRQESLRVRWSTPSDSSGIAGYNYVWSRQADAPVPHELGAAVGTNSITLRADADGTWYFRIAATDYAGNWSEPATVAFTLDTAPPEAPRLAAPPVDQEGFLKSNSFSLSWRSPPAEEPLSGYRYALRYLGASPPAPGEEPAATPRESIRASEIDYRNLDNGYWVFAVAAVDLAGNVSAPASEILALNKYVPVTYISYVQAQRDPLGGEEVTIRGRGFSQGGLVSEVILDRDGAAPYDYVFPRAEGLFRVVSDRTIDRLQLGEVEEGTYRVGVLHPTRGLAFTSPVLRLESPGTVKFGNFAIQYNPPWREVTRSAYLLPMNSLLVWLVVGLLAVLLIASARRMVGLAREGQILQHEILAVLRGEGAAEERETRMRELKRKGAGLRLKFTLLTMVLVLITVLMVSFPLSLYMLDTQRRNLVQGLEQRTNVLLGSLVTGAENNLRDQNRIELGLQLEQTRSMEEAIYATITGVGEDHPDQFDYVWATNDANVAEKIQAQGVSLDDVRNNPGTYRIEDSLSPLVAQVQEQINTQAQATIGKLSAEADALSAEARQLVTRRDQESQRRLRELQNELAQINSMMAEALQQYRQITRSYPAFDAEHLGPQYVFFRPVVFRRPGSDTYFRGAVRLAVSTARITAELARAQASLLLRTGIIALIAAGLGLAGTFILASITITPIKKLAAGVAVIRDTEDKEQLREHVIDVRSKDEIGSLAATVNQMTQALVKAAIASKDLTVGKEVQKMFIPLDRDENERKGTTGGERTQQVELYGYYEGAKGVSGDYFDFKSLDGRHYALIKCDVAGKGVPAALIMVEVATIFSTYFRNWTSKEPGLRIDRLAYQINDMLEERGFKGRFAALTLSIIDGQSGKSYFCNAGDTNLHIFKRGEGQMKEYKLPQAPAAGVFPSDLVEMQSGFKQVSQQLEPGDTVFLFTDGIEEAKSTFRDSGFLPVKCQEPGLEENQEHGGTHLLGAENEELGITRIYGIINAVFNRKQYTLRKFHSPVPQEDLVFDFTGCQGSVEEAVLGLVAVEKVFRIIPDPGATREDRVHVDGKIDQFLQRYFTAYPRYFARRLEGEGQDGMAVFTHLKEDEQYDDLTILAVRKL